MILEPKQTTAAYRCPKCGAGVMSAVGVFSLSADMLKLKCTCHGSEMTLVTTPDKKVRLTVPCMFCPKPHTFTLGTSLFFERELLALACPYTDMDIAFLGDSNRVKAELARSELELLDLMEKSGMQNFDTFHEDEDALPDPQILDIIMFVINDMDAEGKIDCRCAPDENEREYRAEVTKDGVKVSCAKCGASRTVPTDSRLSAHAFLNADALHLE